MLRSQSTKPIPPDPIPAARRRLALTEAAYRDGCGHATRRDVRRAIDDLDALIRWGTTEVRRVPALRQRSLIGPDRDLGGTPDLAESEESTWT